MYFPIVPYSERIYSLTIYCLSHSSREVKNIIMTFIMTFYDYIILVYTFTMSNYEIWLIGDHY